jgi:hypothetical protein
MSDSLNILWLLAPSVAFGVAFLAIYAHHNSTRAKFKWRRRHHRA